MVFQIKQYMKRKTYFFFLVINLSLLISCSSEAQKTNLSADEFEKAINQPNIQVLDVRTLGEYQSGHLSNAFLADWTDQTEFQNRVKSLDKSKPVYAYCLSGVRSADAAGWLRKNGFIAYNLAGGIAAWKRNNKPVEQAVAVKQITKGEYEALIPTDKTVLVDFGAVWCAPCKKMIPVLDSLQAKHGSSFQLVKIDGGEQVNICKDLSIEQFPTFIIYKQGKEVWRKQGIVEMSEFEKHL
jgi:rhodanese-related sulfurtransferase